MAWETPRFCFLDNAVGRLLWKAVREQAKIGWEHLVKGWLSHHWRRAQEQFYAEKHRGLKVLMGKWWLVFTVHGMWSVVDLQWRTRNARLHGATDGLTARELQDQIQWYYFNPYAIDASEDMDLFRLPLRM